MVDLFKRSFVLDYKEQGNHKQAKPAEKEAGHGKGPVLAMVVILWLLFDHIVSRLKYHRMVP